MKRKDEDRTGRSTTGAVVESVSTLESFIGQLHAEGVQAGRQEAERLRTAATTEAAAIVARAEEQARQLLAEADKKAKAQITEARAELALAVRDVQLELREKLSHALTSLLREGLDRELRDATLLRELLRDVVSAYVRDDGTSQAALEVHVRVDLADELAKAVPSLIGSALSNSTSGFDLKTDLRTAGFEYRVRNAMVEVTPESVAEKLAELVTPQLRALLREAADQANTLVSA